MVVGGGVSGLTTAFCLQDCGFDVVMVAERFGALTPSVIAGALWEWPPAVCGYYESQPEVVESEKLWSLVSYRQFLELASMAVPGVYLRPVTFYSRKPLEDDAAEFKKLEELCHHVQGFRHDVRLIAENGIADDQGFADAYTYVAPQIDMEIYLAWLEQYVFHRGARKVCRKLSGNWSDIAEALRREYRAQVVIQATGLGAGDLGDPRIMPVRGALLQVINDGLRFPILHAAHCTSLDILKDTGYFLFIVPRREDRLLLGGFAEPGATSLDLSLESPLIREIHRRCIDFMPRLQDAVLDPKEPLRVGLRPFRRGGVRVEADLDSRIIHNYGHGGSGVLLSWGCAREVASFAEQLAG